MPPLYAHHSLDTHSEPQMLGALMPLRLVSCSLPSMWEAWSVVPLMWLGLPLGALVHQRFEDIGCLPWPWDTVTLLLIREPTQCGGSLSQHNQASVQSHTAERLPHLTPQTGQLFSEDM